MMRDSFRSFCKEKLMPRVLLAHRNEGKKMSLMKVYLKIVNFTIAYRPIARQQAAIQQLLLSNGPVSNGLLGNDHKVMLSTTEKLLADVFYVWSVPRCCSRACLGS
jgi:hypothetical protein